ncbi:type II toxin-antitoxin system HipA family toxin [Methylopila sp. M107]|uniref:type II toxin-antitoxin system HipA family toxin n=1 Tax=Methylopila sp. M107 TaxID=1101190 RepID=UPI000361DA05|nr:type II toxin-antitoxin system HipA family toxin [Methylopila sp. M107]
MRFDEKPVTAGEWLQVTFAGREIGRLQRDSQAVTDLSFRYDPAWIRSDRAFPISISMPLSDDPYQGDIVHPWFMNLLPEGRVALRAVGAALKVNQLDVFAMLAAMGEDLPGALELRPPEAAAARKPRYRSLTDAELADAIRRLPARPLLVGEDGVHMSLAGAQEKLAVAQLEDGSIGLALDGAPSTHILKPANKHFHASVENEAFCLRLAKAAGLPAAEVSVHAVEDIPYLLVKRYDRLRREGEYRRLHQEDFCQALGVPPQLKYEWNSELSQPGPTLDACFSVLRKTREAAANVRRFLDAVLFNILAGNVDAHAKNYSLLIGRGGATQLAPLYDVMNGQIYEGVTNNLAMKVAGRQRGRYIFGRHWIRFAEKNNLNATFVKRRVAELSTAVLERLPSTIDEMDRSMMPSNVYGEIAGHIAGNCRNMISNLSDEHTSDHDAKADDADLDSEGEIETVTISPFMPS